MIDPTKFPMYDLPYDKLEEVLVFAVAVAHKNAKVIAASLDKFLKNLGWDESKSVFEVIRSTDVNVIAEKLKMFGVGCHNSKARYFKSVTEAFAPGNILGLDLKTCTVHDLQSIYGIGPKTARFFILHTRRDANCACLDVHILKYLRGLGYDVPLVTPRTKRYGDIEKVFLQHAKELGMHPAKLDIEIWKRGSNNE